MHHTLTRLRPRLAHTLCVFTLLGGTAYAAGSAGGPVGDGAGAAIAPKGAPVGTLTLPGITGDGPGGSISVRHLQWDSTATVGTAGTGGGAGKTQFGDVVITKAPDRSTPQLWQHVATGQHMSSATVALSAPRAAAPYATYSFKDVTVKSVTTRGEGGGREDRVRLEFSSVVSGSPAFAFDASAPLPGVTRPLVGRMTVDGIPGTIDLTRDAWGVSNSGAIAGGGGGGAGKATFDPFEIAKPVDAASAELFGRFRSGEHTRKVTIELLTPGADVYATYVLTDVVETAFDVSAGARATEDIALDAARVESTVPVAGGAPVSACFDQKLASSC